MAKKKPAAAPAAEEFRADALAQALEKQDMAAIALSLRNGNSIVPLISSGDRDNPRDSGEVWTYRDAKTGDVALLLFSDARNKPANLPPTVAAYSAAWLEKFLVTHEDTITTVFIDIAGPHPMQAAPADILEALRA